MTSDSTPAVHDRHAPQDLPGERPGEGDCCPWCGQPVPHEKYEEIRARIAAKERQDYAALAARLEARYLCEKAEAETRARSEAVAAMQARLDGQAMALAAALRQLEEVKTAAEDRLARRLGEERERLEAAKAAELNALHLKAFEERLRLEEKLAGLQRQLQKRTSGDLGETAESDLYEDLRKAFPEDRIVRAGKGAPGPDIFHDVRHNGRICGRIVYDAKNRNVWRNGYVSKLRQDQAAAAADHAVLASHALPAGTRQLCLQDGVIVAAPGCVPALADLLRQHLVQIYSLRISNEAKAQKTAALYDFIVSDRCTRFLSSIASGAGAMRDLDTRERRTHEATWRRRDELIRTVERARGELCREIDLILGLAPKPEDAFPDADGEDGH